MKCRLLAEPPSGADWVYEIKFDGFRALALKGGRTVELLSRSNKSLTARFPTIAEALSRVSCREAIIDGEVVALDQEGRSSFQQLQMAEMPGQGSAHLCYYAFDLIQLDGRDLRALPLTGRKTLLQKLLVKDNETIRFSRSIEGDGSKLLEEVRRRGLEGIIAKNRNSPYEAGARTGGWAKIKCENQQEFVIGGYTAPQGARSYFGALLVGYFDQGRFLFASKVGTGFNHALLEKLYKQFQRLRPGECPFANLPEKRNGRWGQGITAAEMRKCTWVEPRLVCQVRFTEWTRDEHLRHPAFLGLRDDKNPLDVIREKPVE